MRVRIAPRLLCFRAVVSPGGAFRGRFRPAVSSRSANFCTGMRADRSPPGADAPPRRVAIVLMSAVGSTVQGMPIVASLRRAWPAAQLTWVLQPGPATLMAGRPDFDRTILFHRRLGARAYSRFRREVAGEAFDLVICLLWSASATIGHAPAT